MGLKRTLTFHTHTRALAHAHINRGGERGRLIYDSAIPVPSVQISSRVDDNVASLNFMYPTIIVQAISHTLFQFRSLLTVQR